MNLDLPNLTGQQLAVAGGVLVALALAGVAGTRLLRRADRRQLLVVLVSLLAAAIGAVAFQSSLTKLTELAGSWAPGSPSKAACSSPPSSS